VHKDLWPAFAALAIAQHWKGLEVLRVVSNAKNPIGRMLLCLPSAALFYRFSSIDNNGTHDDIKVDLSVPVTLPKLESLVENGCTDDTFANLHFPNLTRLELDCCALKDLTSLLSRTPKLQSLAIKNALEIKVPARSNLQLQLRELSLDGSDIEDTAFDGLLSLLDCSKMRKLCINECNGLSLKVFEALVKHRVFTPHLIVALTDEKGVKYQHVVSAATKLLSAYAASSKKISLELMWQTADSAINPIRSAFPAQVASKQFVIRGRKNRQVAHPPARAAIA